MKYTRPLILLILLSSSVIPITDPEVEKKLEQLQNFPRNGRLTKITPREHQRLVLDKNNTRISAGLTSGTSKNQAVQKPRMKISISFPEDKVPGDFLAALWFYNSTAFLGSYNHYKETLTTEKFNQTVEISGLTTLTFLEFISGRFSLKLRGDRSEIVMDFNITFQESPGEQRVDVSSNFSFNITITCSMEDVEINGTFICENNTCRQEGAERSKDTKSGASLRLYLLNSTIICSHSNQISKTQTTIQPNPTSEEQNVGLHVVLGVLGGFLLLLLLGVGWCILKKRSICGGERSRREKSLDVPPQSLQHLRLLEGIKVFPSQDEQMELNQVSWSQSGKSLQGDDEEDPCRDS